METGGGDTQGHGMVLVMHMVKQLKSVWKFSELLTKKYDLTCHWLHCLEPFHNQFTVSVFVCAHVPRIFYTHYTEILNLLKPLPTGFPGAQVIPPSLHAAWCRGDRARSTVLACEESDGGCAQR